METLYREEMKLDRGGDHTTKEGKAKAKRAKDDNIMDCSSQGTSRSYTLTRLSKDRPDLFEKVVEGDMSANAAAIEAGFRPKTRGSISLEAAVVGEGLAFDGGKEVLALGIVIAVALR